MKRIFILIIAAGALLTSCTAKYNITQTPDDVYYSPVRGISEDNDDNRTTTHRNSDYREIRMSRYDRRWYHVNNDYGYGYDPYHYGYNYGYYYNPYYYPLPVYLYNTTSINPKNSPPRTTNLSSYTFHNTNPVKTGAGPVQLPKRGREYNNSNQTYTRESNSTSSGSSNSRTYQPSQGNSTGGSTNSRPVRVRN